MPDQRDAAISLMQQQRFAEALPLFLRLTESNPDDWSLFYMVGQCYRFTNNVPEAARALKKAADLNPDEAQVFLALGIAYQLADDYRSAIAALEQAIRLDPQLFSAYNSIGLTYKKSGELRKALEWYSRAAEGIFSAVTDEVHKDREKCYQDEIIDGAKTRVVLPYTFEKTHEMLRSDPMYAIIKNNIGVCLIKLGDVNAAREQFRESIECIPDGYNYPDPYRNLESIS
jgi:tetratricopeptide (TPR) repeat protein